MERLLAGPIKLLQPGQHLRRYGEEAFEGPRVRAFGRYRANLDGLSLRTGEWDKDGLFIDDLRDWVNPGFVHVSIPALALPIFKGFYSTGVSLRGTPKLSEPLTWQVELPRYNFLLRAAVVPSIDELEKDRYYGYTTSWEDPKTGWAAHLCARPDNPLLSDLEFSLFIET